MPQTHAVFGELAHYMVLSPSYVVSCPAHVHLPARNGLVSKVKFLGLIPQNWEDQWDCEIANYYVPYKSYLIICSSPFKYPYFFEPVSSKIFWLHCHKTLASPRNSTWFTRPFLLVRGWGLGTRLGDMHTSKWNFCQSKVWSQSQLLQQVTYYPCWLHFLVIDTCNCACVHCRTGLTILFFNKQSSIDTQTVRGNLWSGFCVGCV